MSLSCNLYIDGKFNGIINSSKEISIGKQGEVQADIKANKLIIQGFVDGKISAESVEIKADGKVKGTIESAELIIESQGIFEGTSIVKKSAQQKQITKDSTLKP